jgi:hypothetical protein
MKTCHAGVVPGSVPQQPAAPLYPGWFIDFLADRAIRKPSPHTAKAYRQDFEAIATLLAAGVQAADPIPESRRCFPCLAAEEFAERGRVRHTYPPCDRCAGELGVR